MPVKIFKDNSGNATEVKDIKVCVDGVWKSVYGSSSVTAQFITFIGRAPTTQKLEFKNQITLPTISGVTGYNHTGWTCNGTNYSLGQKVTMYGSMVFTAVWTAITFNIYLYSGGSLERTLTCNYGSSCSLGGTYANSSTFSILTDEYADITSYAGVTTTLSNVTSNYTLYKVGKVTENVNVKETITKSVGADDGTGGGVVYAFKRGSTNISFERIDPWVGVGRLFLSTYDDIDVIRYADLPNTGGTFIFEVYYTERRTYIKTI